MCTDASWATRPDRSTQGGTEISLTSVNPLIESLAVPLIFLKMRSCRRQRVRRLSLSVEARSAANAVDMLTWFKVYASLLINPTQDLIPEEMTTSLGLSSLVIDSKGLYDMRL